MGVITNVFFANGVIPVVISVKKQGDDLERFISFDEEEGTVEFNSVDDGNQYVYTVKFIAQNGSEIIRNITLSCALPPTAPPTTPVTPSAPTVSPSAPTAPITPTAPTVPTIPTVPTAPNAPTVPPTSPPQSSGGFTFNISGANCDSYYEVINCITGLASYTSTYMPVVDQLVFDSSGNYHTFSGVVITDQQPNPIISVTLVPNRRNCPDSPVTPIAPTVVPSAPIPGCVSDWVINPANPYSYCSQAGDLVVSEIDGCGGVRERVITEDASTSWSLAGEPFCENGDRKSLQVNLCGDIGNKITIVQNDPGCCSGSFSISYTGQNPIRVNTAGGVLFLQAVSITGLTAPLSYDWSVSVILGSAMTFSVSKGVFAANDARISIGPDADGPATIRVVCTITGGNGCTVTKQRDFQVIITQ